MYIKREIEDKLKENLFKGKIIVVYGARQVGKTTLVKKILLDLPDLTSRYINCDEADYQRMLFEAETSTQLKAIIGDSKLVVIDEAQRIKNIGLKLKLLVDNFPDQQIIATGSSSFELADEVAEPLTGRSVNFWLYPLSLSEIRPLFEEVEIKRRLENFLVYGNYPAVFEAGSLEEKKVIISSIAANYLYKDILRFQKLKNADIVRKLLEALALQIGNEVSYNELSSLVGVSKKTIASYIEILEKAFIIFRLRPFSRNLRKELGKLRKIYFCDLGVRNILINNLNPLSLRSDIGQLWENFVVAEKMKKIYYPGNLNKFYFWRTYDKAEVDLVEDKEGKLFGYEIKWKEAHRSAPKSWQKTYPQASWQVINSDNFLKFF